MSVSANQAAMPQVVDVCHRKPSAIVLVFLTMFTCGIGLLLYWLGRRLLTRSVDREGLTKANGERLFWRDLVSAEALISRRAGSPHVILDYMLAFKFTRGHAQIHLLPLHVENGPVVLGFIESVLGRRLGRPPGWA